MKIIIPMAGRGSRLRPHTLTTPKPLLHIVGKPIVQRLVEDIAKLCKQRVEEIAFIIGDFGKEVEQHLVEVAASVGAKGSIFYQNEPLGTAHAIFCAEKCLQGQVIVAFADTLFRADFSLDTEADGIIWVKQVANPSAFGVVKFNDRNEITDFVEKPTQFVSDLAIIGIYYFKDGQALHREIKHLLDNNITEKGEFQLTNALENLKAQGKRFLTGTVQDWLDCGNKNAMLDTNQQYMSYLHGNTPLIHSNIQLENCTIIEPVFIAEGAELKNSVVGPYVSVGAKTKLSGVVMSYSIVGEKSYIQDAVLRNSLIGSHVVYKGQAQDLSLGDYCLVE